jgi:hypothetical protein
MDDKARSLSDHEWTPTPFDVYEATCPWLSRCVLAESSPAAIRTHEAQREIDQLRGARPAERESYDAARDLRDTASQVVSRNPGWRDDAIAIAQIQLVQKRSVFPHNLKSSIPNRIANGCCGGRIQQERFHGH